MARVRNAREYHRLYDWSGSAHVQGLHCHACAVLTSCYLSGHKRCGRCQLDKSFFSFKLQSPLPNGRREWVVGYIPRFVGDLN